MHLDVKSFFQSILFSLFNLLSARTVSYAYVLEQNLKKPNQQDVLLPGQIYQQNSGEKTNNLEGYLIKSPEYR